MQDIRTCWDASIEPGEPLNSEMWRRLYDRAKHNLQFFAFRESTPSPVVSREMRSAFLDCAAPERPFFVLSSTGIRSAFDVRIPDPALSTFIKKLPLFPKELLGVYKSTIGALQERGMLKDITFEDVLMELRERPLSEEEVVGCLRWWIDTSQQNPRGIDDIRRQLLGAARLAIGSSDDNGELIIPLEGIQTFLNLQTTMLPTDGLLPNHLLPISVSQKFNPGQLQIYIQWRELTVLEWVQHLADPAVYTLESEFNITESPVWAARVLQILAECWLVLSEVDRISIVELLRKLACIPTSTGVDMPGDSYLSGIRVFRNLPVVNFPSGVKIKGNLERVLGDLGVRKHVELDVVYDRWVPYSPTIYPSHLMLVG